MVRLGVYRSHHLRDRGVGWWGCACHWGRGGAREERDGMCGGISLTWGR